MMATQLRGVPRYSNASNYGMSSGEKFPNYPAWSAAAIAISIFMPPSKSHFCLSFNAKCHFPFRFFLTSKLLHFFHLHFDPSHIACFFFSLRFLPFQAENLVFHFGFFRMLRFLPCFSSKVTVFFPSISFASIPPFTADSFFLTSIFALSHALNFLPHFVFWISVASLMSFWLRFFPPSHLPSFQLSLRHFPHVCLLLEYTTKVHTTHHHASHLALAFSWLFFPHHQQLYTPCMHEAWMDKGVRSADWTD